MADRWHQFTFSELISTRALEIGDGYRAKISELGGNGPIFLRAGHVTDAYIDFAGADRFHANRVSAVASKMSQPGDVIITTKGNSTGRVAFVDSTMPTFVYSPHLSYWRSLDLARIVPGFLRYWSQSPEFQRQLAGFAASTDMAPYLSLVDQRRLQITLPPAPEQNAIAQILSALDDKIELNRRMNETLVAMARAIFKSWFVDFDPVRAKAEGRKPSGMDAATAALFPDSFEDSPLGKIPKGWRTCAVGDVIEVGGGSTPSTKESAYWDGQIHWATPKDLSALRSPVLLDTQRRITHAGVEQIGSRVYSKGTVLLSSRAPIGYLAISEVATAVNQGMIAMVCADNPSNHFMVHWTRENMEAIEGRASGTTFQEISKSNFRSLPLTLPTPEIMKAFTERVELLHRRIVSNERESNALAATRDTLLPKLISGQIRVNDVENAGVEVR